MKNIFFVGNLKSSFIKNDYRGLQKYFNVRHTPMKLYFKLNILETIRNVIWANTIFCWFASFRAVIPTILGKILSKKVVAIAGGYDCVFTPEINYGAFTRIPDRWVSKFVFRHADIVLPVSKYIQKELLEKITPYETHTVYNGVDANKWYPQGVKDEKLVMTVGEINWNNLQRKGIEDFVKTAVYLPDVTFLVIGEFKDSSIDYLKLIATSNVKFAGRVSDEELLIWYQRAKVYAQLSYHEGFGVSVAEAMLCDCTPVLSTKGALPEVGGKNAYYTSYGNPYMAAMIIKGALRDNKGGVFRARIMFNFQIEKRIGELREIL